MKHAASLRSAGLGLAAAALVACLYGQAMVDTKNWTTADDHKNMMEQLGIKALRPGPSGNESAPNHANYDEATANPYPDLPDVLTLKNGKKVTSKAMWNQRRAEIVEDFDREVLGRVPKNAPKIQWTVNKTEQWTIGGHAVGGQALIGRPDNAAFPAISVDVQMTLVLPADAKKPVPVMVMFGNQLLPSDAAALGRGRGAPPAGAGPRAPGDPPATEQLIADGW